MVYIHTNTSTEIGSLQRYIVSGDIRFIGHGISVLCKTKSLRSIMYVYYKDNCRLSY